MLARLDLRGSTEDLTTVLGQPDAAGDAVRDSVREIIADVRARGDAALRDLTERFDGVRIDELRVPAEALKDALADAPSELRGALEYVAGEITAYHEAQRGSSVDLERDGIRLRELVRPVDRAGCYVPGGRATYPSSVVMTAIPARVAGVAEIVLCTPPGDDGEVPSATLAAAAVAGVDEVYRVGGAQAIAALAFGTDSIAAVDVVVGPGNAYVAAAKREVAGVVGIEALAGPSEVVVVADQSANAELVAADLIAQVEHGPGGKAILVTWSDDVAAAVDVAVAKQLASASAGAEIERTLATAGQIVLVDDVDRAVAVVNVIAPEHVELLVAEPEALVDDVRNAGAIFCGPWAPAVVGDYVAGVNHVLPTARTARFASALRVDDFCKHTHVVDVDEAALRRVAPYIDTLSAVEGLAEHGRSVALRVEDT
jgi:histidinol dehydrogenase